MKTLILFIGLFSLGLCEYNYRTSNQRTQYPQYYEPRNEQEWSSYSFSVDEGQCRGSKLVDEDVQKEASQFTFKKSTYTWDGRNMYHVTCIRVLNRMPRDQNAGEARITDGGVGQGKVRIEMRSQNSQKLHFHVEIWGEETRAASGNLAVLTANSVLHLNGKKYCECR